MVEESESHSDSEPVADDHRYRSLFDAFAEAALVIDRESGRILEVNAAAVRVYGYSRAELCGLNVAALAAASDQTAEAVREGSTPVTLRRHLRKDGSLFQVELRVSLVEWAGRAAAIGLVRELTGHPPFEEVTRDARTLVDAVVDNVPLMIFLKEASELRFVLLNRAGEALVGDDRGALLGKNDSDLFPAEQAARFIAADREVLEGEAGVLDIPEEPILTTRQGLRLLHTRKVCIRGADGTTKYLLGVSEDITERRRAEDALRSSEARFRTIINASPVPMALNDEQQRVVFLNPAFIQTFGYSTEDIPTLADWWPRAYPDPEYRQWVADSWRSRFEHAKRTGAAFAAIELTVRCKDGSNKSVLASAASLSNAFEGEHLVVLFDVTELKRLQAGLAQADRLASMGMLAAGVAHEINNPLAYVLANIETLAQRLPELANLTERCCAASRAHLGEAAFAGLAGENARFVSRGALDELVESARSALEGTNRIAKISRGLGTFSRAERVDVSWVDVNRALESAATMAANEVRFRARLVKDLGQVPAVLASEGRLSQVFLNLIINAAHAIDEGRVDEHRITLRTWVEGDDVYAEVADTGRGIPPENMVRIFEPFFTTKTVGTGSGLGLAISKNIIAEFGGDLRVESEVGRGTRVIVRLPQSSAPSPPLQAETTAPAPASEAPARGRLLIVDDEAQIRRVLKQLLGTEYEVVTVASGLEAKALLEKDRAFDVVLCDLMMHEMSGMALHAWLADWAPDLAERVVFASGGAFTPSATDYLARLGNLRLEKPFDLPQLRRVVAESVAAARRAR